jgi:putative tryptophan/tyrosine transport system substrate-binding protein
MAACCAFAGVAACTGGRLSHCLRTRGERQCREGIPRRGEIGFVEGQNVTIEYRWAQNDRARLPELVADLVSRRVAVIATPASVPAAVDAKAATTTIPIVFSTAGDPVQLGIVASFSRPGGNITGVASMNHELLAKRFELLVEAVPTARRIAVLVNPNSAFAEAIVGQAQRLPNSSLVGNETQEDRNINGL